MPRRVKRLGMFAAPPPPEKRSLDPTLASATRSVLSQADLTREDYVEYCLHLVLRSQLPPPRTYTHTHTHTQTDTPLGCICSGAGGGESLLRSPNTRMDIFFQIYSGAVVKVDPASLFS